MGEPERQYSGSEAIQRLNCSLSTLVQADTHGRDSSRPHGAEYAIRVSSLDAGLRHTTTQKGSTDGTL